MPDYASNFELYFPQKMVYPKIKTKTNKFEVEDKLCTHTLQPNNNAKFTTFRLLVHTNSITHIMRFSTTAYNIER